MWWTAFKYAFFGILFGVIGVFVMIDSLAFHARSEPAQLLVLQIDQKRDTSHRTTATFGPRYSYRPVFGLVTDARPRPTYAGNVWMRPAPHTRGDTVAGRYDASTGEMRSDQMSGKSMLIGGMVAFIGLLAAFQGLLIFLGIPEFLLPLRLRGGT
jgi:hypothetical protein